MQGNTRTQITLTYNGQSIHTTASTLTEILQQNGITEHTKGIAVAQNQTVINRNKWHKTPLMNGDTIEVVRPFQGG